jgi:SAM-dependent methyltransferase
MARDEVVEYFARRADGYDDVEDQLYWNLSDDLLWHLLTETALPDEDAEFTVLDAGGGTGRWILRILEAYENSRGVLFDLSEDMLAEARAKVSGDVAERIEILQGDLNDVDDAFDAAFDVVISFHNVLGFVEEPGEILENLAAVMAEDATAVSFVPNKYHGVYFNTKLGNLEEAARIASDERGTFVPDMPPLHFFTPTKIERMYAEAGFRNVRTFGLPVSVYPGFEETRSDGNTASLEELLSDEERFERIKETEKQLICDPEAASRGNNIFVIGER